MEEKFVKEKVKRDARQAALPSKEETGEKLERKVMGRRSESRKKRESQKIVNCTHILF